MKGEPKGGPLQPDDNECRTCAGITILTAAMREKGEKPICVGKSDVLKQRIPWNQLDQLNKDNSYPGLTTAIIIGLTRSSRLMDRTGCVPVCVQGIQLIRSGSPILGAKDPFPDTPLQVIEKGVKKQLEAMDRTWSSGKSFVTSASNDFPQKATSAVTGLTKAMDKTARAVYKKISTSIGW